MTSGRKFLLYERTHYVGSEARPTFILDGPYKLTPQHRDPGEPKRYVGKTVDVLVLNCFSDDLSMEIGDTVETVLSDSSVYAPAGLVSDKKRVSIRVIHRFLREYGKIAVERDEKAREDQHALNRIEVGIAAD